MIKLLIALTVVYAVVAILVFVLHVVFLQMVTPGLALVRALLWPIWIATGWPAGTPLPMD